MRRISSVFRNFNGPSQVSVPSGRRWSRRRNLRQSGHLVLRGACPADVPEPPGGELALRVRHATRNSPNGYKSRKRAFDVPRPQGSTDENRGDSDVEPHAERPHARGRPGRPHPEQHIDGRPASGPEWRRWLSIRAAHSRPLSAASAPLAAWSVKSCRSRFCATVRR